MAETISIIGAGMAGLTTAAYLARAGLKVDVYEQHTLPGGYISSFVRKGFTFPAGPSSITSNGIVFPILRELGLEGTGLNMFPPGGPGPGCGRPCRSTSQPNAAPCSVTSAGSKSAVTVSATWSTAG